MSDDHEPDRLAGLRPGGIPDASPSSRTGVGKSPKELAAMIPRVPGPSGYDRKTGRWVRGEQPREREPNPEAPPPDPTHGELEGASRERAEYYAYLQARARGEDVKPPPVGPYRRYWGHVGG